MSFDHQSLETALTWRSCSTLTVETQTEMEAVCLRNLDTGLKTGKLAFTVPEQKGKF